MLAASKLVTLVILAGCSLSEAAPVDYLRDIKPLLTEHCVSCHGAKQQKGGLRLDTVAWGAKGGAGGPAFKAGHSVDSLLIQAVRGTHPAIERMPYKKAALSERQIARLCVGGRDYFYDDAYCAVVPADPRQIRDAVNAMIARKIPRDYIRAKTMRRVERDRSRFIAYVQAIIDRRGGNIDFSARFPLLLRENRLKPWMAVPDFAKTLESALQPVRRANG